MHKLAMGDRIAAVSALRASPQLDEHARQVVGPLRDHERAMNRMSTQALPRTPCKRTGDEARGTREATSIIERLKNPFEPRRRETLRARGGRAHAARAQLYKGTFCARSCAQKIRSTQVKASTNPGTS
eukprot:3521337-Pleurochrysis_carterae.AAC.4